MGSQPITTSLLGGVKECFRTATIAKLSEFFDLPDEHNGDEFKRHPRMFPSASKVSREHQALKKHALSNYSVTTTESDHRKLLGLIRDENKISLKQLE